MFNIRGKGLVQTYLADKRNVTTHHERARIQSSLGVEGSSLGPQIAQCGSHLKVGNDRPLIPEQQKEGKPAYITRNLYSNFLESTV